MLISQLTHGECEFIPFKNARSFTILRLRTPRYRMMYSEILDFHNVEGAEDQAQEGLGAVQDAQAQAQQATMASMQASQA